MDYSPHQLLFDELAISLYDAVGSKLIPHLVDTFGTATQVFGASAGELVERAEIKEALAKDIASRRCHPQAEAQLEYCRRNSLVPVNISSEFYPPLLKECCDMPLVLYVMGDPSVLVGDMFAVVGTRDMSNYGALACERLIGGLRDYENAPVIASGLAYGVDAAAHRAALNAGLKTVAVLGNKPPRIYPSDNYGLARSIAAAGGCVISELHEWAPQGKMNFVARNRIIAGMSRATLVVESPMKGGSMITADMAAGYDRTVMAVPGRINDENSAGTNFLIRKLKAVAVTTAADVAEELGLPLRKTAPQASSRLAVTTPADEAPSTVPAGSRAKAALEALRTMGGDNSGMGPVSIPETVEDAINVPPTGKGELKVLVTGLIASSDGITVDTLAQKTGSTAQSLTAVLFELELEGSVKKAPGGMYIRK